MSHLQTCYACSISFQVHGEVTDPGVDVFDLEKVFIDTILRPLIQRLPLLKVVMEHITTADAVKFVESCKEGLFNHLNVLHVPNPLNFTSQLCFIF